MKKLILIPALLTASLALASDYNYEITPLIGYNIAEGNLNLDDSPRYGVELQYNGFDFPIKPELSIIGGKADYDSPAGTREHNKDTKVCRVALNGVYEFDKIGMIVPLAKAGIGYEDMSDTYHKNTNSAFVDAGVGAKIPFTDALALKLETVYMLKYNHHRYDSNLAILAGLNFAFGATAPAPIVEEIVPEEVTPEPVVLDSDNDGVIDSQDSCPTTPAGNAVDSSGCCLDDDKDGVINSKDSCPTTPRGNKVDSSGCCLDDDKDGVINSKDICKDTPLGDAVNIDGCSKKVNLNVNFENNSYVVDAPSQVRVQKYADFLSSYTNYSATIVGYTDSRGRAAYNQKLSQNRANAVKDLLIEMGAPASSVSASGKGETNPIADNATKEGRAQNRRIEAELIRN